VGEKGRNALILQLQEGRGKGFVCARGKRGTGISNVEGKGRSHDEGGGDRRYKRGGKKKHSLRQWGQEDLGQLVRRGEEKWSRRYDGGFLGKESEDKEKMPYNNRGKGEKRGGEAHRDDVPDYTGIIEAGGREERGSKSKASGDARGEGRE